LDRGPVESVIGESSQESVTGWTAELLVIGPSSNESTVSQVLLWLCREESSGNQEGERPPLEACTCELGAIALYRL
jgi:hypothetical protein